MLKNIMLKHQHEQRNSMATHTDYRAASIEICGLFRKHEEKTKQAIKDVVKEQHKINGYTDEDGGYKMIYLDSTIDAIDNVQDIF